MLFQETHHNSRPIILTRTSMSHVCDSANLELPRCQHVAHAVPIGRHHGNIHHSRTAADEYTNPELEAYLQELMRPVPMTVPRTNRRTTRVQAAWPEFALPESDDEIPTIPHRGMRSCELFRLRWRQQGGVLGIRLMAQTKLSILLTCRPQFRLSCSASCLSHCH
jgi:hypothetical protein